MARARTLDRAQVVAAAVAVADAEGLESVTLARLAAGLGIRIPSLYNHVAGLDGLRAAMALWGVTQLGDAMRRAAVGRAGADAVRAIATAYRSFALAHPGVYPLTQRAPAPDDAALTAAGEEVVGIVLAVLAPYGLDDDEMLHAVRGLRSLLHGFVDLEVGGGFGLPLSREASFEHLVTLFIDGLNARSRR